jgi:acyl-CoA thioester hydrolase
LDSNQHVNNATYLSYFEEARTNCWFDSPGPNALRLGPKGVAPVLADTWVSFRRPVALPDKLHVGMRVERIDVSRASIEHRYVVWSETLEDVAAQGGCTIVMADFDKGGVRAELSAEALTVWAKARPGA